MSRRRRRLLPDPHRIGSRVRLVLSYESGKIEQKYIGASGWEYAVRVHRDTVVHVKHQDLVPL